MRESLDFIWANDHENRESMLTFDKIPNLEAEEKENDAIHSPDEEIS